MSTKRKRSVGPDFEVVVGGQSFYVLRAVLCCVSDVFDTMLDAGMNETNSEKIELPDKDPAEWKQFYTFIDPSTARFAKINEDNVDMLASWFNEYQMLPNLEECDQWIHGSLEENLVAILEDTESEDDWDALLRRLDQSNRFAWPITRTRIIEALEYKISESSELISVDIIDRLQPLLDLQEVIKLGKNLYMENVAEDIRTIFAERVALCEMDAEGAWNLLKTSQLVLKLDMELESTHPIPEYSNLKSVTDATFIAKVKDDVKELEDEPQLDPSTSDWDKLFKHLESCSKNPRISAYIASFFRGSVFTYTDDNLLEIHTGMLSDLRVVLAGDADVTKVLRESIEQYLPENVVEQIADTELHESLCWSLVEAHIKISQLQDLKTHCLAEKYKRAGGMILRMQKADADKDRIIESLPSALYFAMPAKKQLQTRASVLAKSELLEIMKNNGLPVKEPSFWD